MAALPKKGLSVLFTVSQPNLSTSYFPSDNKDACRCSHRPDLLCTCICFTWEWHSQWNGEKDALLWTNVAHVLSKVKVHSSLRVPENALAASETGGASSGQSGPLYINRRAVWDTIPSSLFGLFPTWTLHIPFRMLGGKINSHQHLQHHQWPS